MPLPAPLAWAVDWALDMATGRHPRAWLVPVALFLADCLLCPLILARVPYTEIDWVAYMEQVAQVVGGERDYRQIAGGTGPLVYPAAHVYAYTALYRATAEGTNIALAQQLFTGLYLVALATVMLCYWRAGAPPYVFPLLILSKRLHSIYLLRCFNDGLAALCLWLALLAFQRRRWTLGILAYAWGLGTKMTLLLSLPAVAVVLVVGRGWRGALRLGVLLFQIQLLLALPFLKEHPGAYLGRAFELSRAFLFRWTVNWRFVGEAVFLSRGFALALLGLHAALLLLFLATRWLRPTGRSLPQLVRATLSVDGLTDGPFSSEEATILARAATPQFVTTTILTANVVGLLAARSLHYQFYAYLAWATPYLLWRSGLPPASQAVLWALQEWAWNVYPSTAASSGVVVGVLAATVGVTWWGAVEEYGGGGVVEDGDKTEGKKKKQ